MRADVLNVLRSFEGMVRRRKGLSHPVVYCTIVTGKYSLSTILAVADLALNSTCALSILWIVLIVKAPGAMPKSTDARSRACGCLF